VQHRFEPLIRRDNPALRRSRLSWVRQNYIRAETLTRSKATLVAAQNRIPLARAWGGGGVASADGLRFVVPVRTIHSGPNQRYYGQERGVTFYNLVSDQFTGLNGITVPGTLRESPGHDAAIGVAVVGPMQRVGRAPLADEVAGAGAGAMNTVRGLSPRRFRHRQPGRRDRHVGDDVDQLVGDPVTRDAARDVGLVLMVRADDTHHDAGYELGRVLGGELGRNNRSLARSVRIGAAHVGQHADADRVVRDLGHARQRRNESQQSECECLECGCLAGEH